jgi:ABC-2 type transport system ATP-binding protein
VGGVDVGLEVVEVRRRFGEVVALADVSLTVDGGSIVGFVGRNGAGKTTAMRVIMGLVAPDEGEVRWRGAPIDRLARLRFGYMPEERGLYPKMKVAEQLRYLAELSGMPPGPAHTSVDRWIEVLGLETRRDSTVDELSLGNQQRVQLGAALVHEPDLLILDEPFSGLDPVGVDVLSGALRAEAERGVGVLFSSHQLDLVERVCDEVVIIEAGRIVDHTEGLSIDDVRVLLDVDGADPDWCENLDGVEVVERRDGRVLLELAPGIEPASVADAAWEAGPVRLFQVGTRSLEERFRAAVDR